jgi:predicted O-methyltransferase YrrM
MDGAGAVVGRLTRPARRWVAGELDRQYGQVEALVALYAMLDIKRPLPSMRDYAVAPDFACRLASLILATRPSTIVEFGSGVSTLVAAYAVKKNGIGIVHSVEHDSKWCAQTGSTLEEHGLSSLVTLRHAPLKVMWLSGANWMWYDTDALQLPPAIDVLVVDGPPANPGRLARYPALPVVRTSLSGQAVVLVDDADRPDETAMVARWTEEYGPAAVSWRPTERGLAVLTFEDPARARTAP